MLTYSHWQVLFASPDQPLPKAKRVYQLTRMYEALRNLEKSPKPKDDDWHCLSDCTMLMDALKKMGEIQDPEGLIEEAYEALGRSAYRRMNGQSFRLNGPDIQLLRCVLAVYSDALDTLPARTMLMAHRSAEKHSETISKKFR